MQFCNNKPIIIVLHSNIKQISQLNVYFTLHYQNAADFDIYHLEYNIHVDKATALFRFLHSPINMYIVIYYTHIFLPLKRYGTTTELFNDTQKAQIQTLPTLIHTQAEIVRISDAYRNEHYVCYIKFYICLKLVRGHVRQICLRPTMEANLYS